MWVEACCIHKQSRLSHITRHKSGDHEELQVRVARSGMAESTSKTVVYLSVRHPESQLEQRKITTVKVMIRCSPAEFITRFSALLRMQRIAAYWLRFAHNASNPSSRKTCYLASTELRDAPHACIKIAQQQLLKKLMTSTRRARFLRRGNCSLCTHFLTRKVIF